MKKTENMSRNAAHVFCFQYLFMNATQCFAFIKNDFLRF